MTSQDTRSEAIQAMVLLNAAVRNIRIYPPTSGIIDRSIDRLHEALRAILEGGEPLIFAESEKNLLVCGQPLSEKEQKKPQAVTFLGLLLDFGIKSLTFEQGLERAELQALLSILSRKPEEVEAGGGARKALEEAGVTHVSLDEKVYVAKDKDHQIVAALDIKDSDIVRYVAGDTPPEAVDLREITNMVRDPEWVAEVFRTGLRHVVEKRVEGGGGTAEQVVRMIRTLEGLSGEGAEVVSDALLNRVLEELDDEQFERLAASAKRLLDGAGTSSGPLDFPGLGRLYEAMALSEKGRRLEGRIQERIRREEEQEQRRTARFEEAVTDILEGEDETFLEEGLMEHLPEMIERLLAEGKQEEASRIVDRLGEALASPNPTVRTRVAEALSRVLDLYLLEGRAGPARELGRKLAPWLQREATLTPAHERIFKGISALVRGLVRAGRLPDGAWFLALFSDLAAGGAERDAAIRDLAEVTRRELGAGETLETLLEHFRSDDPEMQREAALCLVRIGPAAAEPLLDLLEGSQDRSERRRILQALSDMGGAVAPLVAERIERGGAWYYLRNLALLLGRIGDQDHLAPVEALLGHEDHRVRREGLNTVYRIGGNRRAEILLSHFPPGDDRLLVPAITMLGDLKAPEAVQPLLDLVDSKEVQASKNRDEIAETICRALGRIGTPEAVSALRGLAESKGFSFLKPFRKRLKAAAAKVLQEIGA